jgi:ribosomal protein L29
MNYNVRLFWALNIFYWMLHYTIQAATSPIFLAMALSYRLALIGTFLFWIMLITGLYRLVHQKLRFGEKSIPFTGVQILISAIIMAGLDVLCRFQFGGLFSFIFSLFPTPLATDNVFGRVYARETQGEIQTVLLQFQINGQWMKFMVYIIWVTAYNFYHLALNFRQKTIEKLDAENRAKDLELINLRSQLNPHFLFNALNSIHALAMMKKDTASDSVLLLSDLMRYTLNYEKRDLVLLSEEMEVVEKYLKLEKIRFGSKLTTELTIADATLPIKIPPIIVQTLVENAIKHGLQGATNGVFIKINSQLNGDLLTINIINSGQVKKETPSVSDTKNGGIGVENTRRRLAMIYGEKASFDLKNLSETEVIATLTLPINN